jgi:inosine kinase
LALRFPGNRNPNHYFPVTEKATRVDAADGAAERPWYIVGLDEVLVDIEVTGPTELARSLGLVPGESVQLSDAEYRRLQSRLDAGGHKRIVAAGGTVANTLNNYTYLSGEAAVLLGAIESSIRPGTPAFAYVAQTPAAVDLSHIVPVDGSTGTAITFVGSDGERSFGVAPGVSGAYPAEAMPAEIVRHAAVALTSLYCLRPSHRPIAKAALAMMQTAKEAGVPVAFGMGTAGLVREKRQQVQEILAEFVCIAAMNALEAEALTGEGDALLAAQRILDWVDCVIITEGPRGLTMAGYTDEKVKRHTKESIRSKSIAEYNRWEYSRLMRREDCESPLRVYSHIHPYRGGPDRLRNTSGAGDAALAALLHDAVANAYHRETVPTSEKHAAGVRFLTYSSLSRTAQYGNRVAYEVLRSHSPRLSGPVGHDDDDDDDDDVTAAA